MAEWRVGRGWSERELVERLEALSEADRNFRGSHEERVDDPAWEVYGSRSNLPGAPPGRPARDGPFQRGRAALTAFAFSDPAIVEGHFREDAPLLGRRMLLELKVPLLRYLCGVVVGEVRDVEEEGRSVFGYRYETLEGHIERGSEWFLLEQDHASGALRLRIEAAWKRGDFPNWWSAVGFSLVGKRQQRRWHRRAHARTAAFVEGAPLPTAPVTRRGRPRLRHAGPEVVFTRGRDGEIGA